MHYNFYEGDVVVLGGKRSDVDTRGKFDKSMYAGINRLRTFEAGNPNLGVDLFAYRA